LIYFLANKLSYKNSELEQILQDKHLLNKEKTGINRGKEDKTRQVLMQYIKANSGFPNNILIKSYWFLKSDRFSKGVDRFLDTVLINNNKEQKKEKVDKIAYGIDWFVQGYFGGAMNRRDQNLFALTANKKPYELTLRNAWMSIALSPQYAFYSGIGMTIVKLVFPEANDQHVGLGLTGLIVTGNLTRIYLAKKNKNSYAGFGIEGISINISSYWKRRKEISLKIREKIVGNKQNYKLEKKYDNISG